MCASVKFCSIEWLENTWCEKPQKSSGTYSTTCNARLFHKNKRCDNNYYLGSRFGVTAAVSHECDTQSVCPAYSKTQLLSIVCPDHLMCPRTTVFNMNVGHSNVFLEMLFHFTPLSPAAVRHTAHTHTHSYTQICSVDEIKLWISYFMNRAQGAPFDDSHHSHGSHNMRAGTIETHRFEFRLDQKLIECHTFVHLNFARNDNIN